MTSYALSLTVVVVDPRRLDLVFLAGKPAGGTETLSGWTLKIMSLAVVTEEIVSGASLSGDAHARRPLHKIHGVLFFCFSFSTSVVGTSGFAPSATSGPLILPVLGKIWAIVFTYFANFESSRRCSRLHLVDFGKEVLRFPYYLCQHRCVQRGS